MTLNPRFVLFVVLIAPVFASCNRKAGSFSAAFANFNPQSEFSRLGYSTERTPQNSGVRNDVQMYGWHSWSGTLSLPTGTNGCDVVAAVIYRTLTNSLKGGALDELTRVQRTPGMPLHGMLRYNQNNIHGDVFVWLIPDSQETNISYAILLREEPLRK